MAGTSWDKLGQMDAAFEVVAPAIRRVARAEGARLHEFFNEDPIWRLTLPRGDDQARVDVVWEEDRPDAYRVRALWWAGADLHSEEVGEFRRQQPLAELEGLLEEAIRRSRAA